MQFFGLLPEKLEHSEKHQQIADSNNIGVPIETKEESIPFNAEPYDDLEEETIYTITNNLYTLELSNAHGGTIKSLTITEKDINGEIKYTGSYDGAGYSAQDFNNNQLITLRPLQNDYIGYLAVQDRDTWSPIPIRLSSLYHDGKQTSRNSFTVDGDSLVLVLQSEQIEKTIIFYKDSYVISNNISIKDPSLLNKNIWIGQSGLGPTEKKLYDEAMYGCGLAWSDDELWYESYTDADGAPDAIEGTFDWTAIRTKYFISTFIMNDGPSKGIVVPSNNVDDNEYEHFPRFNMFMRLGGAKTSFLSYMGPLDITHLEHPLIKEFKLRDNMNLGWWIMRPISRGILWVLNTLHTTLPWPFNNYGIILILFAFLVRIITGPLTRKSYESNQKLQLIQPKMQKIKDKYKNDSQRMNQELIKLYRDEGVNPVGGCLPMLLQMPLLVSLFTVFRLTIEFRGQNLIGSSFHWINDLSSPDVIPYTDMLGLNHIPLLSYFYGHGIGLLPLINGVVMILTMRLSSKTMSPEQKPTMFIMQGVFMLLFNTFPAGLNLYYTTYNILSYVQQKNVKSSLPSSLAQNTANKTKS